MTGDLPIVGVGLDDLLAEEVAAARHAGRLVDHQRDPEEVDGRLGLEGLELVEGDVALEQHAGHRTRHDAAVRGHEVACCGVGRVVQDLDVDQVSVDAGLGVGGGALLEVADDLAQGVIRQCDVRVGLLGHPTRGLVDVGRKPIGGRYLSAGGDLPARRAAGRSSQGAADQRRRCQKGGRPPPTIGPHLSHLTAFRPPF